MNVTVKAAALAVVMCCGLLHAQTPQWHSLYPRYAGLTTDGEVFLAVTRDGVIKTMNADGGVLRQQFEAVQNGLREYYAAAYGDGRFVVTRNSPMLRYSANGGLSWSEDVANANCRRIVYGRGGFVGIDVNGLAYTYRNELGTDSWSWMPSEGAEAGGLYGAAASDQTFVAVGGAIYQSSDGSSWTVSHSGYSGDLKFVAFGNDKFVAFGAAGGTVYTAEGGGSLSWETSASNVPADMNDLTFGNGLFVAVGKAGVAASSEDGITWTPSALNANDNFVAVRYGGGVFMAVGDKGSVYTSADGVSWSAKAEAPGSLISYNQVIHGGGKFVAVGDSGISVSSDGQNWIECEQGPRLLRGVAYGNDKFVAVGDSGALYESEDGLSWTDKSRNNTNMLLGVAYGNGRFIAVGRIPDGLRNSPLVLVLNDNDAAWKDETQGNLNNWTGVDYPLSIVFGGSGDNAKFITSSNSGKTRSAAGHLFSNEVTIEGIQSTDRIHSIIYTDEKFIALSTSGTGQNKIFTSTNGTAWSTVTAPPEQVRSVTYAKGHYVAVGDAGRITASQNGQTWASQSSATNRNLQTICFADGKLVAAGAGGALLYSDADPSTSSIRHTVSQRRAAKSKTLGMSMNKVGQSSVINLQFVPEKSGVISVYSLSGKRLYRKNLDAGVRSINLPGRLNGSVIVRYVGSNGKVVSQRFQIVR